MIWSKRQFIGRLKSMKKHTGKGKQPVYLEDKGYNEAIDDILNMIEVECGCFRR